MILHPYMNIISSSNVICINTFFTFNNIYTNFSFTITVLFMNNGKLFRKIKSIDEEK
jgi:hypothetical protein